MPNPKVSVLMSVYNAESFLREAMDSVLNQSFHDFEFIIFDDKSSDRSLDIIRSYHDSRIVLVANDQNQGLTRNLIRGMAMVRGEHVARMDADDICLPRRLGTQVEFLTTHADISVVGSAVTFFDGAGYEFMARQPSEHDAIKCELLYGFTMLHPSVMMRKADFDKHGLNYDPHFVCSQDHDLWTRSIRLLRFANIQEPLLKMREHDAKLGRIKKHKQQELSNEIRKRQLDELGVNNTTEELMAFNAGAAHGLPNATCGQLAAYDRMVCKIVAANKLKGIFHQATLERMCAAKLRALCRRALLDGNPAGRYYWRSELRKLDECPLKHMFGLVYRSICCFAPGRS